MSPDLHNLQTDVSEQFLPLSLITFDSAFHKHAQIHHEGEGIRIRTDACGKNHFANQQAGTRAHGVHGVAQDPPASVIVVVMQYEAEVVDVCVCIRQSMYAPIHHEMAKANPLFTGCSSQKLCGMFSTFSMRTGSLPASTSLISCNIILAP